MRTKQVIVVRNDLQMRKGKMAAQVAHASLWTFLRIEYGKGGDWFVPTDWDGARKDWLTNKFFKIVLRVDSEEELLEVKKKCDEAGIENQLIEDCGHTVFKEPTNTCLGIGPDWEDKIDEITGHLKLMN